MAKTRLAMVLHNHQPIGNFDGVIEAAYADSYLPFLEVMEKYPTIPFCLHTSGCLMEWLVERRPDYVDRLRRLVRRGQVEIVGGAYYEPILPMIPARDRQGQIRGYSEYLLDLFDQRVRGMWLAERVWEQNLVPDLVKAGIEYLLLDDYHFRKAGLHADDLHGYYATEDEGFVVRVFPGSEPMRYMIPFQDVNNILGHLRWVHDRHPNALVVFGDDGEKFGAWPNTKAHVYEFGWIYRFLDALTRNADWIEVCTLSQALDQLGPLGKVYLPDCSYREMTEWALPSDQLRQFERVWHRFDQDPDGQAVRDFLKGGYWRNFKVKNPETNEMYARMMEVSARLENLCASRPAALGDARVNLARQALYRGQCNCPYWHGSFGGLYLPHLRNAIYTQLIIADNQLLVFEHGNTPFVELEISDWNYDSLPEVRLANEQIVAYLDPATGGQLYELDARWAEINLGASLSRRPEAYHEKIRQLASNKEPGGNPNHASFKQQGLEDRLAYDNYPRKSLVDHFLPLEWSGGTAAMQRAIPDLGDFARGAYQRVPSGEETRNGTPHPTEVCALARTGTVQGCTVTVRKTVALAAGANALVIDYNLEALPGNQPFHFGVEWNFAALAAGADDRYYFLPQDIPADSFTQRPARLGDLLELSELQCLGLADEWLGIHIILQWTQKGDVWSFPVQTVSQSEAGYELVHQSVCVLPHWRIPANATSWTVRMTLTLDTSQAQARRVPMRAHANA